MRYFSAAWLAFVRWLAPASVDLDAVPEFLVT
jgi:hypothetical protein